MITIPRAGITRPFPLRNFSSHTRMNPSTPKISDPFQDNCRSFHSFSDSFQKVHLPFHIISHPFQEFDHPFLIFKDSFHYLDPPFRSFWHPSHKTAYIQRVAKPSCCKWPIAVAGLWQPAYPGSRNITRDGLKPVRDGINIQPEAEQIPFGC